MKVPDIPGPILGRRRQIHRQSVAAATGKMGGETRFDGRGEEEKEGILLARDTRSVTQPKIEILPSFFLGCWRGGEGNFDRHINEML